MKYQGDPEKFNDHFRDVVDSGKVNVAKGETKKAVVTGEAHVENQLMAAAKLREEGDVDGANKIIANLREKVGGQEAVTKAVEGLGQKRASIYEDLNNKSPEDAKAEVLMDKGANKSAQAQSRKMVAMLSPDGTHVIVGTASETKSNGKPTHKVSTYDIGAGRKAPGGEHYSSSYDKMVEQGWKPLASLKSDKPMKGVFQTYSIEQWRKIEGELRETKTAAQRTTEAMMQHLEAAKEYGRGQAEDTHGNSGDEKVEGNTQALAVEQQGKAGEVVHVAEGSTADAECAAL